MGVSIDQLDTLYLHPVDGPCVFRIFKLRKKKSTRTHTLTARHKETRRARIFAKVDAHALHVQLLSTTGNHCCCTAVGAVAGNFSPRPTPTPTATLPRLLQCHLPGTTADFWYKSSLVMYFVLIKQQESVSRCCKDTP